MSGQKLFLAIDKGKQDDTVGADKPRSPNTLKTFLKSTFKSSSSKIKTKGSGIEKGADFDPLYGDRLPDMSHEPPAYVPIAPQGQWQQQQPQVQYQPGPTYYENPQPFRPLSYQDQHQQYSSQFGQGTFPDPSHLAPSASPGIQRRPTEDEDRYELLAQFDTVFLIDDSGSMTGSTSRTTTESHWQTTRRVLSEIVPICAKYDTNGVDIFFFNSPREAKNTTNPKAILKLFAKVSPSNGTPFATRLKAITKPYIERCEAAASLPAADGTPGWPKPRNTIVFTDGEADDPEAVVDLIVNYASRLDKINAPKRQLGIQIFQVGNVEGISEHMKQLDNTIKESRGVRDIVDTVPADRLGVDGLSRKMVLKVVLGGVVPEIDAMIATKGRSVRER